MGFSDTEKRFGSGIKSFQKKQEISLALHLLENSSQNKQNVLDFHKTVKTSKSEHGENENHLIYDVSTDKKQH